MGNGSHKMLPALAALTFWALISWAYLSTADGQTLTTMVDHGPSANRVDIVFFGDGYTDGDLSEGDYEAHIHEYLQSMFANTLNSDPFYRYRNFFNVHCIDVVSDESGADKPFDNFYVDTALDASYAYDGVTQRLLYINDSKANAIRNAVLAGEGFSAEMQFVTVNDTLYGGGGGNYAVYAGGNSSAREIALHEMGHSFSNLADEYGGHPGETYAGGEPGEPNVTTDPTGAKWSQWIGYDQPGIGTIDAYEGARYWDHGIYRPSNNSKMRSLGRPFDAVSREQIILDIYELVDPLDGWIDNSQFVIGEDEIWVDTIDDAVIQVDWTVDNQFVAPQGGERLNLAEQGFNAAPHFVTARAYDATDWVRINREELEQSVTWIVMGSAELAADVNRDGRLAGDGTGDPTVDDIAAFIAGWRRASDPTTDPIAAWEGGDLNLDGITNLSDWCIIHQAWPSGGEAAMALRGSVPEPSAMVLALVVAVGFCTAGQRSRFHNRNNHV